MTPWVLERASQFRLPPPYFLSSAQYAADLNETKTMGAFSASPRTADQSELALFWQSNTPLTWNRVAAQISIERGLSFHENVHLFALLNVTMADAVIACWDSKYRYSFWRPITAIREGLTPTAADPTWEPWLDFFKPGTPAFRCIPQPTPRSAARRRLSSPPFSGTTPPTPSPPNRVRGLVRSPVSPAPLQKSLTLVSSAASISALPVPSATHWEARSQTMYRGTPCAARWRMNRAIMHWATPVRRFWGRLRAGRKIFC